MQRSRHGQTKTVGNAKVLLINTHRCEHEEEHTGPAKGKSVAARSVHVDHDQHNIPVRQRNWQAALVQNTGGHGCNKLKAALSVHATWMDAAMERQAVMS